MRQLLMLGFYCEVYRREPRCRVYVNDMLLDEFNIPHTPKKYVEDGNTWLNPEYYNGAQSFFKSNPIFLKYIEFNDRDVNNLDIKIEIQNIDNNHTNGFMTKSTQIVLASTFLLSKKLLGRIDDIKNNWKLSRKNYNISNKSDIDLYYSGRRNVIFDNFADYMLLNFPNIVLPPKEKFKLYCNNWQDLPLPLRRDGLISRWWIGSSGYFHLTVKKKLGFWRHTTDYRKGLWQLGLINFVGQLYDKYKQYENQRSSNTRNSHSGIHICR